MNVTVAKTVPIIIGGITHGHTFYFNNAEELNGKTVQVWLKDVVAGFYRQLYNVVVNNGTITFPVFVLAMKSGSMCIQYDIATNGVTNAFTYSMDDVEVIGGSVNLGVAPNPPNYTTGGVSQLPPAPAITPTTTTTTAKKKR